MFENYYIKKVSVKCSICNKPIEGVEIPWEKYYSNIEEANKNLIGLHCQNCGRVFCATEHNKELQNKLFERYEKSICPNCKETLNSGSAIVKSRVFGKIIKIFPKQNKDILIEAMYKSEEGSAHPEAVLYNKADVKKKIIRFLKIKSWRENLEKVVRKFYSNLLDKMIEVYIEPNFTQAYQSLVPNFKSRVDEKKFKEIWDAFIQKRKDEIKKQEHVVCAECGKEYDGIWAFGSYNFPDTLLKHQIFLLVRCSQCGSVYCSGCYIGLKNRHSCPNCGKKMAHRKEYLDTFLAHQYLEGDKILHNVIIEKKTDCLADILYDVTFRYRYNELKIKYRWDRWEEESSTILPRVPIWVDLGERGKVTLLFYNQAVKIGKEWRIVSPYPGTLLED